MGVIIQQCLKSVMTPFIVDMCFRDMVLSVMRYCCAYARLDIC